MADFKPTLDDLLEHGLGSGTPPPDLPDCPVCMEPFRDLAAVITPCLHWFCRECLTALVKSGHKNAHKCPSCRYEMCEDPNKKVEDAHNAEEDAPEQEAGVGLATIYENIDVAIGPDGAALDDSDDEDYASSSDDGDDSDMNMTDIDDDSEDDGPNEEDKMDSENEDDPDGDYEE
ncbi:uncharacterized protein RCC_04264 [Ramularia collo-cygni]|uniref:RING-type domain-containing protein n=1 Tax=Ramularia collo-cygni TaxID=112498 RepID=A0A2D3VA62_9PEZI|nr:uncharacterized protein RCC_04264 [Ramularia collo-cygni]CZT18419.1 uncharacterized protein RCC_04264 [Ramularia collo-cygni]